MSVHSVLMVTLDLRTVANMEEGLMVVKFVTNSAKILMLIEVVMVR